MTLFEVHDLTTYWSEAPPLHLVVAGLLRSFGGGESSRSQYATMEQLRSMVAEVKGAR